MKEYLLNYCSKFKCIAGACKHTCCSGWEMQIDKQSLAFYKNHDSNFSNTLKKGINFKKSAFKRDSQGRCAFLNDKGLCELIINLGEQSLCQVCSDHPRFRSFFDDRVETGLGFCCEQATRIILSSSDKIQPVLVGDDGKNENLDFIQKSILDFRTTVLEILQDQTISLNDRINSVLRLCRSDLSKKDYSSIVETFLSLERLDESWTDRLNAVKDINFNTEVPTELENYCQKFLVNGTYRHLSGAEDTLWVRARTIACVQSWWIIQAIINSETKQNIEFEQVVDVVRAFSAEVEYSQQNLDKLFSFAFYFINI